MKPRRRPKWFPTAVKMLATGAFAILVVLMTPSQDYPTARQALAVVAFVIFVLQWPKLRRAFVRRKVRRVRGARRLSKIYRRSRRQGTPAGFSSSAQ